MNKKPIVIVAGASGVGKTTIIKELLADKKLKLKRVTTSTTRPERPGTKSPDRHLLSKKEFKQKMHNNEFIETAEFYGNLYGVQKVDFEKVYESNNIPIFDVDLNGVRSFKKELGNYPLLTFFIIYDSPKSIKKRLIDNPETRSNLNDRLKSISKEEKLGKTLCEYIIENKQGNIAFAVNKIKNIISEKGRS